jgi:hypothetical protein
MYDMTKIVQILCFADCSSDNLCNENQLDALLILNLFRQSTSTCFRHIYCPSSGGIHCICTAVVTCYTFKLTGC